MKLLPLHVRWSYHGQCTLTMFIECNRAITQEHSTCLSHVRRLIKAFSHLSSAVLLSELGTLWNASLGRLPWAPGCVWPPSLPPRLPFTPTAASPTPHANQFPPLLSCLPALPPPLTCNHPPSPHHPLPILPSALPITLPQLSPGNTRSSSNRKAGQPVGSPGTEGFPQTQAVRAALGKCPAMPMLGPPEGNCPAPPFSASHTVSSAAQLPPGSSGCSSFSRADLGGRG